MVKIKNTIIKRILENEWISFGRILSVRLSDISITATKDMDSFLSKIFFKKKLFVNFFLGGGELKLDIILESFPSLTFKINQKSAWTLTVYLTEREGWGNKFSRNKNSYLNLPEQVKLSWKLILTIFSSPGIRTQTEIIPKVCFQIYYTFLAFFLHFYVLIWTLLLEPYLNKFIIQLRIKEKTNFIDFLGWFFNESYFIFYFLQNFFSGVYLFTRSYKKNW